ncbi:MAG: hypothetical protein ACFFAS_15040 [Promethearchaeota archaeon]
MTYYDMEDIPLEKTEGDFLAIQLPELDEKEKNILDPIVAPTSGLRIKIYDEISENKFLLTRRKFYLFLRFFRAISQKYKELKKNEKLAILIVTDDRPSNSALLHYSSAIFKYEGFKIYHQKGQQGTSLLSSPYGAASVALYNDIDIVIVITASHNDLSWNGIKFYIDYPMPMSGILLNDISKKALKIKEIFLKMDYNAITIDAEQKNNDYVIELLSKIINIESMKDKSIVIWPYLGKARGIMQLFKHYGANVVLVEEEVNPPNPIKVIKEDKLKKIMEESDSEIALLLDADRDRIALYIKQGGNYITYIPNEIYSAMHNMLSKEFGKKIINIRTIPSDPRGDDMAFLNILTGVGYKHLGAILYFLMGVPVEKSKIDTAILYLMDQKGDLMKLDNPEPLKNYLTSLLKKKGIQEGEFILVLWEESGGHTLNILDSKIDIDSGEMKYNSPFALIADKYPVPALVLITELICKGQVISDSIDISIVGINSTITATDEQKIKIMKGFEENSGKKIDIAGKNYQVSALSDNNNIIDIYQLKSKDSILYFRPSGTGPDVRFYIFGKRETYSEEIKKVQDFIKSRYS